MRSTMTHHLVGLTEIAEMLGLTRQRVDQLVRSDDTFPTPQATISAGRVWSRHSVEDWARKEDRSILYEDTNSLSTSYLDLDVQTALREYIEATQDVTAWAKPFYKPGIPVDDARFEQLNESIKRVRECEVAYANALRRAGRLVPHGLGERE